jgi:hypothetical protein
MVAPGVLRWPADGDQPTDVTHAQERCADAFYVGVTGMMRRPCAALSWLAVLVFFAAPQQLAAQVPGKKGVPLEWLVV